MADFTVGQDTQITITGPFGSIQLPLGTSFSADVNTDSPQVEALDGLTYERTIYKNWSGMIEFARVDDTLEELAEQIQNTSLANGTIPDGSIMQTIYNQDGSTNEYTFNNVTYSKFRLGKYDGKKTVMQSMAFSAQTRT